VESETSVWGLGSAHPWDSREQELLQDYSPPPKMPRNGTAAPIHAK